MYEIPRIVSVDDHVLEPPDLFEGRLPKRFAEVAPRVTRERLTYVEGTKGREWYDDPESGTWCDVWNFGAKKIPLDVIVAAVGREQVDIQLATYEEISPGAWQKDARLADMDANWVDAALCFPNVFRFAGQELSELEDQDLSRACVQAYNDWAIDEWAGSNESCSTLLPLTVVPLWSADAAAEEVKRCAEKGSYLVTFPENPTPLGYPSFWANGYWDPFFEACDETGTVVNMHIGSSSKLPLTSPDAPFIIASVQSYVYCMGSLLDLIFSGTLERFPRLVVSYSEAQVGWLPYVLERADKVWEQREDNSFGTPLRRPPSEYIKDRAYFCVFDDEVGLRNRDLIGMDQITFETDYPHPDSTFPRSKEVLATICEKANLTEEEAYKFARGNAIKGYGLARYGLRA